MITSFGLPVFLLLVLWAILLLLRRRRVIIFDYEATLLFKDGIFQRVLSPGKYIFYSPSFEFIKMDMRSRNLTIPGQEVLSADNVSIRASIAITFNIADAHLAHSATDNYLQALYSLVQMEVRELVAAAPIDELMSKRKEINKNLFDVVAPAARSLGLEITAVGLKDIMLPGELKSIFAQVVNARNQGLAALERARGESASIRNLANAAKLLENNPALLQLRVLQAIGESSGNSIVLKLGDSGEMDASIKQS